MSGEHWAAGRPAPGCAGGARGGADGGGRQQEAVLRKRRGRGGAGGRRRRRRRQRAAGGAHAAEPLVLERARRLAPERREERSQLGALRRGAITPATFTKGLLLLSFTFAFHCAAGARAHVTVEKL